MAANPESMPRNLAQVRNMSRSVKADRQEAVKGNFADEMLRIAGGVQTHPFVQLVTFRAGLSPVIVAYTDEQLTSMKRFCCRSTSARYRSVLGVDRTFNLGPCFVTSIVYKNASVNFQESGSPPIFIGPVMFHFDGNESTYKFFFQHIADKFKSTAFMVDVCEDEGARCESDVVFGSDEEHALVNALKHAFPGAQHTFCSRHIEENVRRHLNELPIEQSEKDGVMKLVIKCLQVSPSESRVGERRIQDLTQHVRSIDDGDGRLTRYINEHVVAKLRNNTKVCIVYHRRHWSFILASIYSISITIGWADGREGDDVDKRPSFPFSSNLFPPHIFTISTEHMMRVY